MKTETMDSDNIIEQIKTELVEQSSSPNKSEDIEINVEKKSKIIVGDLSEDENENYVQFIKTEELIIKDESKDDNDFDLCASEMHYAVINAKPVPMGTRDRAAQTLPEGILELRRSSTNDLGIYTAIHFQKGIQFGPYEGKFIKMKLIEGYCWKLESGRLVDESDDTHSNYLRYINCAKDPSEQNLEAFQCNGELYYRTCRDVMQDEELLIYFHNDLDDAYYRPPGENYDQEIYTCQFCLVGLKFKVHRDKHERFCQYRDVKVKRNNEEHNQNESVALVKECDYDNNHTTSHRQGSNQETASHKQTNFLKCTDCDYETHRNKNLSHHRKVKHGRKMSFKCTDCEYETHNKVCMTVHRNAKHEQKILFKCSDCNYESYYRSAMSIHRLAKHAQCTFKCTDCDYETHDKRCMTSHRNIKHERKNLFKCTECDYETTIKYLLKRHKTTKHERKFLFKCTACDYETYLESYLKSHIINNHENSFKCRECDYEAVSKYDLKHHRITEHEKGNIYNCTDCEYKTVRQYDMNRHRITRHEQKSLLKCIDCNYVGNFISDLKRHRNIKHEQKELYVCTDCDYQTYVKHYFQRHTRVKHLSKSAD